VRQEQVNARLDLDPGGLGGITPRARGGTGWSSVLAVGGSAQHQRWGIRKIGEIGGPFLPKERWRRHQRYSIAFPQPGTEGLDGLGGVVVVTLAAG
jgi:hypothetical protein